MTRFNYLMTTSVSRQVVRPTSQNKRWTLFVIVIVALVAVASVTLWTMWPPHRGGGPYTWAGFLDALQGGPWPPPLGTTYQIQDTVVGVDLIATPGLVYNVSGELWIQPLNRTQYTSVEFASLPGRNAYFLDDRRADFPPSVVQFGVTFREWPEDGGTVVDMEHNHIVRLLDDYDQAIFEGRYRPFDANVTYGNNTVTIRIDRTFDVFPLPLTWRLIGIEFWNDSTGIVDPPGRGILNGSTGFLGYLEPLSIPELGNTSLAVAFGAGQEITLPLMGPTRS